MDALSTLNPDQFSSSKSALLTPEELKLTRRIKRMPTPGDVNSSTTPGYLLLNNRGGGGGAHISTNSPNAAATPDPPSTNAKKKSAALSKHLAEIGARAEAKHKRMMEKKQEKLGSLGAGGKRLDDMDAFFFSDDDDNSTGDGDGSTNEKTAAALAVNRKPQKVERRNH